MKEYRLVGPNEGKTITFGNITFVNGALAIQDSEVSTVEPIITRFYGAVPATEFEKARAEYEAANSPKSEDKGKGGDSGKQTPPAK